MRSADLVLQVRDKDDSRQDVSIGEICQLNLMGNVQLTTQTIQALCEAGIPICYFSQGGWFSATRIAREALIFVIQEWRSLFCG